MASSRESFSIINYWKYPRRLLYNRKRNIFDKIFSIFYLIKRFITEKYARKLFIEDNFNRPYNKYFNCKLKKTHRYIFDDDYIHSSDESYYFCLYCGKRIKESEYYLYIRNKKIQKIRKR